MSVPSMVQHRSVVGNTTTSGSRAPTVPPQQELPDCKVKRTYTCAECDYFTQNPRVYLYHLRDAHDEKVKIYECASCLYASRHYQKLRRHNRMVHGGDDHEIQRRVETMTRDLDAAEEEQEEEEDEAEVVEEEEERHHHQQQQQQEVVVVETAATAVVFKCSVCDFSSRSQTQLTKHERDEHIKTKFFRCSKCNYVTHIKARYTKHVKYHSMPMIKCDMCDFRTPYKWNLDRHCKNHNGNGAFRCSACNFTADIKQSLTVHEMNHHVPPVGQAAGLGVGRRRNKVGASDATAAEEAVGHHAQIAVSEPEAATVQPPPADEVVAKKAKSPKKSSKQNQLQHHHHRHVVGGSDFIDPDDIVSHANGKVYLKNKCKLCNFKTAWDVEMVRHERKAHNVDRRTEATVGRSSAAKKPIRPIPNLIPIPSQAASAAAKLNQSKRHVVFPTTPSCEPEISQKDMNDICAKSSNSVLKDFASLFGSEDVFDSTPKVPDLIPAAMYNNNNNNNNNNNSNNNLSSSSSPKSKSTTTTSTDVVFKQKNASFFDSLREKLELGTGGTGNLTCTHCGHESKCLTEQAKHQKTCGKETDRTPNVIPMHNISSTRCQLCRQRCKSSTDLYHHLQACPEAIKVRNSQPQEEEEEEQEEVDSESEGELRIDMDCAGSFSTREAAEEEEEGGGGGSVKPHPMENKVFVWNDILVPMDIEVDDSNYEYTEDKIDDNVSLDLSVRTQSPLDSESSYAGGGTFNSVHHHSPVPAVAAAAASGSTDKVPTHGNDISVAQHKRVFKCPHCTFWASTASRFHVHIVGHLNKKPFECSLCSYRSNWRWDITKHIKLKSVRDPAHESAKVLMTDETGRRNYTKYNKYLTEIPVSSDQSMDTSGGCGTRPKHHSAAAAASPSTSGGKTSDPPKLNRISAEFGQTKSGHQLLRPPPSLKVADKNLLLAELTDRKRSSSDGKRTLFKCKKCNFKDASRDVLLQHVKGHYQQQPQQQQQHLLSLASEGLASTSSAQDLRLRGTSPDRDERHCRLKHSGDIRVVSNKNGHEKVEVEEITDEPDHIDISQEGTFKCNLCPFSNDDDSEFEQHLSGHVPLAENAIKCPYCKYYVPRKEDLFDHLRLHGIPDAEIARLSSEKGGHESGIDGKKFGCTICPYVTNSKSQYTYHKQFHKPRGGQYTCSHCSYNVSKRHLLHQHLKVHGINIASHKQNGEGIYLPDEMTDEIEEVQSGASTMDLQHFPDIPLVWVSKSGKFSKMFKCRYCPHVNLRKVNIQEHEKMHSVRERNQNSHRLNDTEHRCNECNYVCNNAGVLSSHSKVHQGMYGTVHRLVDPTKTDEEQIKELSRSHESPAHDDVLDAASSPMDVEEIDSSSGSGSLLYFCKECPARFLKENEFGIHKRFHGLRLFYKCDYCTYTSREKPHLSSHNKVHTDEYQERTKVLQTMYLASTNYPPQPKTRSADGRAVWTIAESDNNHNNETTSTLCSILSKPVKSSLNVPLSGTDLFLQKSEAEQKQQAAAASGAVETIDHESKCPKTMNELMRGNPDFIYQPYLKNGRLKEKRYKCHMCPTAFEKKEQYKVHLGLHGSKQRYKCDYCDYSVKYYANFVQHLKKHKMNAEARARARRTSDEELSTIEDVDGPLMGEGAEEEGEEDEEDRSRKVHNCPHCPYANARKDAVDNHQKRHVAVSGVESAYTCEHCDYSVPQTHFLKEHSKLHFMPNKLKNQVEGYMICDNLKLTSNQVDEASRSNINVDNDNDDDDNDDDEKKVIFEERGSNIFLPSLDADIVERFNNNEGEKQFVNVQTGETVKEEEEEGERDTSDMIHQLPQTKEECEMEVN